MGSTVTRLELPSRFLDGTAMCFLILPDPDRAPEKGLILLHGAQEGPETILENSTISQLSGESQAFYYLYQVIPGSCP